MLQTIPTSRWARSLQDFSARNVGRRARVETDDLDLGSRVGEVEHALFGVEYDQGEGRIDIMLGEEPASGEFFARSIASARSVDILTDRYGRDQALRIEHGRAQTLLLFLE